MKAKVSMPARQLNLDLPLVFETTDMPITDTAARAQARSGAVSALVGADHLRRGDVKSKHRRSSGATTPTTRTSTTATPTTTTSPGLAVLPVLSADSTDALCSFEALVQAYLDCRSNKRNTSSALRYEQALESNLWSLYQRLIDGTYRPGRSICFVVTRPKPREVWAAEFEDRIVHHALYNHIAPRFHAAFAAASSACIPKRGTLYAAERLAASLRSVTQNWTRPAFYLQLDLSNFFVSIDKPALRVMIARKVRDPWWLRLAETILFHDPRANVELRGSPALLALVPAHKSLFNAPENTGLPIGNLSSQFFANVLLDALDQFVKHKLRIKHYVRYVDDFVLVHEDKEVLKQARREIERFLPTLKLAINPRKTVLQPVARGIDFVGHVLKPHSHTMRPTTRRNALYRLETMPEADLFAAGNSYLGLARQSKNCHTDKARIARALHRRGHAVSGDLGKIYRKTT